MAVLLFEDERVPQLAPLTLTRPAYDLPCGGTRLARLAMRLDPSVQALVRPHLVPTASAAYPQWTIAAHDLPPAQSEASPGLLAVNARLVPHPSAEERLRRLRGSQSAVRILVDHTLVAAWWPQAAGPHRDVADLRQHAERLPTATADPLDPHLQLYAWPHEVVRAHKESMGAILERRLQTQSLHEVAPGVFAADPIDLQHIVCDTRLGPVLFEEQVEVRPHTYFRGPVWVQQGARVNAHASLKDSVMVGKHARVGGEVACSIVEDYANKQHDGYLGHSYLGRWVNWGAGTSNSDLKNTYGEIRVRYGPSDHRIATGMQFLGVLMGDWSRTAIHTSLFTGLTVGVGCGLFGAITRNVPSFVNALGHLGEDTQMSTAAVITTLERMMPRRQCALQDHDRDLIQACFQQSAEERLGLDEGPPRFH